MHINAARAGDLGLDAPSNTDALFIAISFFCAASVGTNQTFKVIELAAAAVQVINMDEPPGQADSEINSKTKNP
eukprot:3649064-Pleurochrysis_carterae.AAC.2